VCVWTLREDRVNEMVKEKETRNAVSYNTIPLSSKGWYISFMLLESDFKNECQLSIITSKVELIRINWDGEPSGYAENPNNWIFL
jgi:hypothetical protein